MTGMRTGRNTYLGRISSHNRIEDLSRITKEFFREVFDVKHEYTFQELKEIIGKKHISPEIKQNAYLLCDMLESLGYRPKKPSAKEIELVKRQMREIVKSAVPKEKKEGKQGILEGIAKAREKIKKVKEKHEKIIVSAEKHKDTIVRDLVKKLKEKPEVRHASRDTSEGSVATGIDIAGMLDLEAKRGERHKRDEEYNEIVRFLKSSLGIGVKLPQIKKELKEMGFKEEKIKEVVVNEMGK
jgi:hypothetical protein